MPADFQIDLSERVVYCRAWGVVTDGDLANNRVALHADPAFEPDMAVLYDFSGVTEVQVTSVTLRRLALTTHLVPAARQAIVAPTDAAFGLARMYSILGGREEDQVFRDRAEALRWLKS